MNNPKTIQSNDYVEGFRGWKFEGGNIEINPALFMVGIAYIYHALDGESEQEFTERLMTKYDLEKSTVLEAMLCDLANRDDILIPGENDPEGLNQLHEVVKNLEL
ncbi:hypothetical protein [Marinobacter salarius]|uniref:hypothetical protein n=1 Tax=Marinobacter salarius TaxID=1420917 RepID=UPI003BA86F86